MKYLKSVPLSELTVQCTLFASSGYMACPLTRGVSPRISLEMGQSSRQIPSSFMRCMMYGCFVNAKPCPILFDFSKRASTRFPSTSVPISNVSPQWKRKGISNLAIRQSFWNWRNSGKKSLRGFPSASSPTRSNPFRVSLSSEHGVQRMNKLTCDPLRPSLLEL